MALRSGHRDNRSFAAYQNLRRRLGVNQKQEILKGSFDKGYSFSASDAAKRGEETATVQS